MLKKEKALLVVDVQHDFLPKGALGVDGGNKIIPVINQLMEKFPLVVASQDWHPANHVSFAPVHGKEPGSTIRVRGQQQRLWPVHCVQDTFGAKLSADLKTEYIEKFFYKGTDSQIDSYSAFFDNLKLRSTGLSEYLKESGIKKIYITGLTLDYCVKFSSLDAKELGFDVAIVIDATCPVNLMPQDGHEAIELMIDAGIDIVHASEIVL